MFWLINRWIYLIWPKYFPKSTKLYYPNNSFKQNNFSSFDYDLVKGRFFFLRKIVQAIIIRLLIVFWHLIFYLDLLVESLGKEFNSSYFKICFQIIKNQFNTILNSVRCETLKNQSDSFQFNPNEFELKLI